MEAALQERRILTADFSICSRISPKNPQMFQTFPIFIPKSVSLSIHGARSGNGWGIGSCRSDLLGKRWDFMGFVHRSRESKTRKSVRVLVRAIGFLRSRKKQTAERRRRVYASLVNLGFRLFLISQADRISALRSFWNDNKSFIDSNFSIVGSGGGHGRPKLMTDFEEDNHGKSIFLFKFLILCLALLAAAFTLVLVLSPATIATLSWLVDSLISLSLVISAGLLTCWMLRTAVYVVYGIFKSCSWIFSEFNQGLSRGFSKTVLLISVPCMIYAAFPRWDCLKNLVVRARGLVRDVVNKFKRFHTRRSTVVSGVREVFSRRSR